MTLLKMFVIIGILQLIAAGTSTASGIREIKLRNSCSMPIRVGLTSGAIPSKTCTSASDCSAFGGVCNLNNNLCFYKSFLPNEYLDLRENEYFSTNLSIVDGQMYSGAIFASTGCDTYTNACETGICRNKKCDQFTGAVGPHTRAEFTFNPTGVDFYDISLMHGVNVPISMSAAGGKVNTNDPYSCGNAGSISADKHLPGCTYTFDTHVNGDDYRTSILFVAPSNLSSITTCNSDFDCNSLDPVCGLAAGRDPTGLPTSDVSRVCGRFVGIWSADEVCIYTAGQYGASPYFCNKMANKASYTDLYGCAGAYANSGYQPTSVPESTCGCYDWDMPVESECRTSNPEWETIVLPWVKLIKDVCPVSYSYAFDDMTSTFTCGGDVRYLIEFCPDGVELKSK